MSKKNQDNTELIHISNRNCVGKGLTTHIYIMSETVYLLVKEEKRHRHWIYTVQVLAKLILEVVADVIGSALLLQDICL